MITFFLAAAALTADAKFLRRNGTSSVGRPVAHRSRRASSSQLFLNSVLAFTRFNCAFPFCPTTALDVCTADERYEVGRPHVIATLIPQTETALMDFSTTTFSAWNNASRLHYTFVAREVAGEPLYQLFTVFIALNGTSGGLVSTVQVALPASPPITGADITYAFTFGSSLFLATRFGQLVAIDPRSGLVGNVTSTFNASAGLVGTRASAFDASTGNFYVNAVGDGGGYFLTSVNVATGVIGPTVGPLPATPGADAGPGGVRDDQVVATLAVYPPDNGEFTLLEMRTSPVAPWIFMATLDPVTGQSKQLPLPDEWYKNWDIDPEIYPEQWPGSSRRMWDYDPIQNYAWFKLYDECDQADDCSEDEAIVYLEWSKGDYVDWYVAVEPIEPEMTQLTWVWTDKIEEGGGGGRVV